MDEGENRCAVEFLGAALSNVSSEHLRQQCLVQSAEFDMSQRHLTLFAQVSVPKSGHEDLNIWYFPHFPPLLQSRSNRRMIL